MIEWRPVPSFPGHEASNDGQIRRDGKVLRIYTSGYQRVGIGSGPILVHRLVAEAFLGKSKLTVNHKNGIKTDNRIENLEYLSYSENVKHSFRNGLQVPKRGAANPKTSLTESEVLKIRAQHIKGKNGRGGNTRLLAKKYSVAERTILGIVNRNNWKHI